MTEAIIIVIGFAFMLAAIAVTELFIERSK